MPRQATRQRAADTFRILVATDNHVGYNERDGIRGNDSTTTFHEVMAIAAEREVDFVLLAGDLFHENRPSRKSMVEVMKALRMNCLSDKPVEFEVRGDQSEIFTGIFDHVNYYDEHINVGIPVFSIHGNHDDPSGEGNYAALDILSTCGLLNYYGRVPEADNIQVKPVLLSKGSTKLALYGISNVRDERLFRTFRDHKVKFFRPSEDRDEWFNLLSVHQNHPDRGINDTNHLPQRYLPEFMDLVVWGHEHECQIDPVRDEEMGFYVMQPGSSIATSLVPGESVKKQVSLLTVTGKTFQCEPIPLKTVRPFVYRDIKLASEPGMDKIMKKNDNKDLVRGHLRKVVNEMIDEALKQWRDAQGAESSDDPPLPLIRLRVDFTAPEGCKFDVDNPQHFSRHFSDRVANKTDVISFSRKKTLLRKIGDAELDQPDAAAFEQFTLDTGRVTQIVNEFLAAQSLTVLPQNSFGDAVSHYVDKEDPQAVAAFLQTSLKKQIKHLVGYGDDQDLDDEVISNMMEQFRLAQERSFVAAPASRPRTTARRIKPKPDHWDSDLDGHWGDQPQAVDFSDEEDANGSGRAEQASLASSRRPSVGRTRATQGRGATVSVPSARRTAEPTVRKPHNRQAASRSEHVEDQSDDDAVMSDGHDDAMVIDLGDSDEEESFAPAVTTKRNSKAPAKPKTAARSSKPPSKPAAKATAKPATRTAAKPAAPQALRQSSLNFSQSAPTPSQNGGNIAASSRGRLQISDDEISDDDDDAFESAPTTRSRR